MPLGLRCKRKIECFIGEEFKVQIEGMSLELPLGLLSRGVPYILLKKSQSRVLLGQTEGNRPDGPEAGQSGHLLIA